MDSVVLTAFDPGAFAATDTDDTCNLADASLALAVRRPMELTSGTTLEEGTHQLLHHTPTAICL
jgi:hypothetical protein